MTYFFDTLQVMLLCLVLSQLHVKNSFVSGGYLLSAIIVMCIGIWMEATK